MKFLGLFLTASAFIVPVPWFFSLIENHENIAVLSQYIGTIALIAMGISQLISTRLKIVEMLVGGLDRGYIYHKWLAIIAATSMILHDIIDAEMDDLGKETFLNDLAEDVGEISLYALLILIVITLITVIPYELWKKSHKFMGAFYALAVFHFIFILKPFDLTDPLGLYISFFCALGILSYLYMLVLHGLLPKPRAYEVTRINKMETVTEIILSPTGKPLRFKAGQFAFIRVGGNIKPETHPFTIASAPDSAGTLSFAIKSLGDFTKALGHQLRAGDQIEVLGAHGQFHLKHPGKPQTWIAGGIGITPFLAWIGALDETFKRPIHLYYCVRGREQAPFVQHLEEAATRHPNLTLHIIDSKSGDRLNVNRIKQDMGINFEKTIFNFCGPEGLRSALKTELKNLDIPSHRFRYEEFELRSGIGFLKLVAFIFKFLSHK